jgi:hypothetical protein
MTAAAHGLFLNRLDRLDQFRRDAEDEMWRPVVATVENECRSAGRDFQYSLGAEGESSRVSIHQQCGLRGWARDSTLKCNINCLAAAVAPRAQNVPFEPEQQRCKKSSSALLDQRGAGLR